MTDLRKAAEMALEALDLINQDIQKHRATLPIGRQPELCKASLALRQALAQTEHVDAINMSQECVDETAKREHEPWKSVQCTCGGTIYFKHTKREWVGLTDIDRSALLTHHDGWNEFGKAIEAKLKEKNR